MQPIFAFMGLLLLVVAMTGTPGAPGRDEGLEAKEELTALERKLAEASARGDAAFLEGVMADDFVGIDASGRQLTRRHVIERLHQPDYQVLTLRHEEIRVHVFGECAVATATTVLEARYKGQGISGRFSYTRVWLKRAGKWRAVFTQSTPSSPGPAASSTNPLEGGSKPR